MIEKPKMKIELNFNDPFKNFEQIERLSKLDGMKEVLVSFATAIHDLFSENEDTEMIEEISDINENSNDPAEIVMQVLNEIPEDDHEQMIQPVCDFVGKLSKKNQISVFKNLGKSLNKVLYDEVSSSTLSLVDLQNHIKEEFYATIDE